MPIKRRDFLVRAGAGSLLAGLPGLVGAHAAFADDDDDDDDEHEGEQRVFIFVAYSQAPTTATGVQPRIGMQGAGEFEPASKRARGGGSYVLFNQAAPTPKPLLASGNWRARRVLGYDTKGLASYGMIQPAILTLRADFDNLVKGATLELVCNVGPAGLSTGEEEGWMLEGTPYGTFKPLSPIIGITHLSVAGERVCQHD
jgi:hypothetical protein